MAAREETLGRGIATVVPTQGVSPLPDPRRVLRDVWHGPLHGAFVRRAARHPGRIAVVDAGGAVPYGALAAASARLAHHLRAAGVERGDVVAVYAHRSGSLVWALLGILRAGAAFLILDPAHPPPHLVALARAARPRAWLSLAAAGAVPAALTNVLGAAPSLRLPPLAAAATCAPLASYPRHGPVLGFGPADPAYVVFTSGTTGQPRGVVGTHKPVTHFLAWAHRTFALGGKARCSLLSGLGHDPLLRDLFLPLTIGGSLHVPDPGTMRHAERLRRWLRDSRITVSHLTPPLARLLSAGAPAAFLPALRHVFLAGDRLRVRDAVAMAQMAPRARLVSYYGTTETPQAMAWQPIERAVLARQDGEAAVSLGQGIEGAQLLVLRGDQLAEVGERGEIYIRSPYLAAGYLNAVGYLNEAGRARALCRADGRFLANPFRGALRDRLFRTGDLGRYGNDGSVRFEGRADTQVCIRGVRVVPRAVEMALEAHPAVQAAVVVPRTDPAGETALVAYAEPATGAALQAAALREQLAARLPEALVPARIVLLTAFPLTPNGKVDHRALPDPSARPALEAAYEAPRTAEEIALAAIWREILDVEQVGVHDDFFALGGHSLAAARVLSRLRAQAGVALPMHQLFERPTVAQLAVEVAARRGRGDGESPLVPVSRDGRLALSFAQQRLWFLDQLTPGGFAYILPTVLQLSGALNRAALARALGLLIQRHETLRTTFPNVDGRPFQRITTPATTPAPLPEIDLSALPAPRCLATASDLTVAEAERPFDLEHGPLLRCLLLRCSAQDHRLLVTVHHIIADGWSQGVLRHELALLYGAAVRQVSHPLPPLPVGYADFAHWQRQRLTPAMRQRLLGPWRQRLEALPPLHLAGDRPRPRRSTYCGRAQPLAFPGALSDAITGLARRRGASPFMVLMAGWMALLGRYSGQRHIAVGVPVAGRDHPAVEGLIGFFVNSLVLGGDLAGRPTFHVLLNRVRTVALDAFADQELPFELLVEALAPERQGDRHPLFQVTLAVHNEPRPQAAAGGLSFLPIPPPRRSVRFDLEVHGHHEDGRLDGELIYSTDLFDSTTIGRLVDGFRTLLRCATATPEARIEALPLLSAAALHQLQWEWDDTERPGASAPLHSLVAQRAAQAPDTVAVSGAGGSVSFAALVRRAGRLATALRELGVGREVRVGVCLAPGPAFVTAILAVLEAGGAYLPLDPAAPPTRHAALLVDAGVAVLLSAGPLLGVQLPEGVQELYLDDLRLPPHSPPSRSTHPVQAAYVLYTSGSTGAPKGVVISHRAISNHMQWMARALPVTSSDRLLLRTSAGFDAAVWEMWAPLLAGAQAVAPEAAVGRDPEALLRLLQRQRITVLQVVPALLNNLVALPTLSCCRTLRRLACGGEPLGASLEARFRGSVPRATLVNLYGPTETTVQVSWEARLPAASPLPPGVRSVPAGRPIDNLRLAVLDADLRLLPAGVSGELAIAGCGLGRGYLRRPAATAARFLPDPVAAQPGARLYRSGDGARWLADGRIEVLGRLDRQVKIRGVRVEPGEVEAALVALPEVAAAAVVADGPADGARALHAYVVPAAAEVGDGMGPDSHVTAWQSFYDDLYGRAAANPARQARFDTVGWISSYTGEPIPDLEMRAWVAHTVARIRALAPRRVLEIGCGTGLLLLRLAAGCERYVGTDFSRPVLAALAPSVRDLPQVSLEQRPADDFSGLPMGDFDTVVLSSVVQYFPSLDYLLTVLRGAVAATAPGGAIFLGDVRSLPLLTAFHTDVTVARAAADLPATALQARVARSVQREKELVVDPAFFATLAAALPRVATVRVAPKAGGFDNELSRFRYDVVFHLDHASPTSEAVCWLDGAATTPAAVATLLDAERPAALGLRGVPHPQLTPALALPTALAAAASGMTVADLRRLRAAQPIAGTLPETWLALAGARGYRALPGGLEGAAVGTYDVLLTRLGLRTRPGIASVRPPNAADRPWHTYANRPTMQGLAARLVPRLRDALAARLPATAVPAAFVVLEHLPTTPSGKLDRRALPPPDPTQRDREAPFEAPHSPLEAQLVAAFEDVLGLHGLGVRDNFFHAGGHSLLATQVVARLRAALGVTLSVRSLFEAPTARALAARLEALQREPESAEAAGSPALQPQPRTGVLPLAHAQEHLWFLQQLQPSSTAYNVTAARYLEGELDYAALVAAFGALVRRHEILRTRFPSKKGRPVQVVTPPGRVALSWVDLAALVDGQRAVAGAHAEAWARWPFDLAVAPPFRVLVLRLAPRLHLLVFGWHHIVLDGSSHGVFWRELEVLYGAARVQGRSSLAPLPLAPLAVQYADFARWQRARLHGSVGTTQLDFWRRQLAGLVPLQLPCDRPRPVVPDSRGATVARPLSPSLAAGLEDLGRKVQASLFMTCLSGFLALLGRYTGQRDVAVGAPISQRDRPQLETLIGCFVNTLVLRGDLQGRPSFRRLIGQMRETALAAYTHQDLPFARLVEALRPSRDPSRTPLFQVMFALEHEAPPPRLVGLAGVPLALAARTSTFDLTVTVRERPEGTVVEAEHSRALFDRTTMTRLLRHFEVLLANAVAQPDRPLDVLPLLDAAERHQMCVAWNDSSTVSDAIPVHHACARQALVRPDAIALECGTAYLSYGTLVRRAATVAQRLRCRGVGEEAIVGMALAPSFELVIGLLGILGSGGAYLPLDPSAPPARQALLLGEADVVAVVAAPGWQPPPAATGAAWPRVCVGGEEEVDVAEEVGIAEEEGGLLTSFAMGQLAYQLYTSGTTGRPKGVQVSHEALAHHCAAAVERFALQPADRVLQLAVPSFDVAAEEIFPTLARGARLVLPASSSMVAAAAAPDALLALTQRARLTVLNLPVGAWRGLVTELVATRMPLPAAWRLLITGSEAVMAPTFAAWWRQGGARLTALNAYGTTETTISAAFFAPGAPEAALAAGALPIGRPRAGTQLYLFNADLRPVPLGAPGELCIAGAGLARGYAGLPRQTAAVFVPDPHGVRHGTGPGARLYRSGDLARARGDGVLLFLGRIDRQLDVRGYRIEPGEVEAQLNAHPAVAEAVVVAAGEGAARRLVAYVVSHGTPATTEALRRHLADHLPAYMVPAVFISMLSLPRTASGKVALAALPSLRPPAAVQAGTAPRDHLEAALVAIWRQVLAVPGVGIDDSFFDLGGHSLLLLEMRSQLRDRLQLTPPVVELFKHPTIRTLARYLSGASSTTAPRRPQRDTRQGSAALTTLRQARRRHRVAKGRVGALNG